MVVKKDLYCSECGTLIKNEFYKCLDNYLQVNFFDTEEENCFCSEDCFCKYMSLEQVGKDFGITDREKKFAEIITKHEEV